MTGENDEEAQQHVDKAACHIGDRYDFPREVDLLDQILLCHNGTGAAGDRRGKEDPRDQGDKQVQIILVDAGFHDVGKHKGVNYQLHQRIDKRPQKAQHGTFIPSTQVIFSPD